MGIIGSSMLIGCLFLACEHEKTPREMFQSGIYFVYNTTDSMIITRFPNYQIEKNIKTGSTDSIGIEWISDSSYIMNLNDHILYFTESDTIKVSSITVNIIEVKGSTYVYHGRIDELNYELTDSVKKLH